MRSLIYILVFVSGIWGMACSPKSTGKILDAPMQQDTLSIVEVEEEPDTVEVLKEVEIVPTVIASIKKTACYGKCPMFEAKVYSNGRVTYDGKQYVDKIGHFEVWVSKDWIKSLQDEAIEAGFFDMETHYPLQEHFITDFPNTVTFLSQNGQEKSITNNHNAPIRLTQFEELFLGLLDELDWKKLAVNG